MHFAGKSLAQRVSCILQVSGIATLSYNQSSIYVSMLCLLSADCYHRRRAYKQQRAVCVFVSLLLSAVVVSVLSLLSAVVVSVSSLLILMWLSLFCRYLLLCLSPFHRY